MESRRSYETVPGIVRARVGDPIRLCVVSRSRNCPPGDNRGVVYRATDPRDKATWTTADCEPSRGGA